MTDNTVLTSIQKHIFLFISCQGRVIFTEQASQSLNDLYGIARLYMEIIKCQIIYNEGILHSVVSEITLSSNPRFTACMILAKFLKLFMSVSLPV